MTVKSILDVEINDAKFKKFAELFARYQAALKALPGAWGDVSAGIKDAASATSDLRTETERQNLALHAQEDGVKKVNAVARTTALVWSSIASSAKTVGQHISSATSSLAKWTTLTSVVSGLLGMGALFGLDRLAGSVSAQRRTAMGLGSNYGQMAAFNANLNRVLVSPGSLLSNISTAKYKQGSDEWNALLAAGISPEFIKTHSVAEISVEWMKRVRQEFRRTPQEQIGGIAEGKGYWRLAPQTDINAFTGTNDKEFGEILGGYKHDAEAMDLTDKTQSAWQDLTTQLGRSARIIETTFGDKLAGLAPELTELSKQFTSAVVEFSKSDVLKGLIDGAADELHSFAAAITTTEFQSGVANFAKWVGDAARTVWGFIASFAGPTDQPLPYSTASVSSAPVVFPPVNSPLLTVPSGINPLAPQGAPLPAATGESYPNTQAGHEAYIRMRATHLASGRYLDPDFAAGMAHTEGNNHSGWRRGGGATGGASDPDDWYDFQMNYRVGIGVNAMEAGIAPGIESNWQKADDFSLEWASRDLSPWNGDQTVEAYRSAGRLPTITVRPSTGNNTPTAAYLATSPYTTVTP